jgi:hypothetical protein
VRKWPITRDILIAHPLEGLKDRKYSKK